MISVVIPVYNKAAYIRQAIESVLAQSYQNFEVVVIDDGSRDAGAEIVESVDDTRIRLIRQDNAGVSAARNRGIAESKGELITFLDADDEWKPDYLQTQYELAQKYTDCSVFATGYEFCGPNGKHANPIINRLEIEGEEGVVENYFEICSCSHPLITSISVMIRTAAIKKIGGFPLGIRSGEDLLTWARLVCENRLAYTKKIGAIYNLGEGYDYTNAPPRRQDEGDPVGKGLKELYAKHKETHGLRKYISRWHKMRASVALRYFERIETLREAMLSLSYNIFQKETYPFLILPLLPKSVILYVLRKKSNY